MSLRTMGLVTVAVLLALPAAAQENGRYQLERGVEGFVRLDTATGDLALCRETGGGLNCSAADEDMRNLRRERDRLRYENRELRSENEHLRYELVHFGENDANELPSDEEMEHIANWFERMMTIMIRTMRDVEDEANCRDGDNCNEQ